MNRIERRLLIVLMLTAAILWGAVVYEFFAQSWAQPLGPGMALPSAVAVSPAVIPTTVEPTLLPPAGPTTTLIPSLPTLTPYVIPAVNVPVCGGPLKMTLLAIGSDTRESGYLYGLSDVIRLVRVDFVTPRVTVLEFPRDLWVQIPDIDQHYGITHGKLNQAYLYGNPGMGYYNGPGQGPGLLGRTLALNFGAVPDHYVAANMLTFEHLIDAIGGIDVKLPRNVDGRKPDQPRRMDLFFSAGEHHLNGAQTLMLARIRQDNVFERADQQNWVLCATRNALLNPQNLTRLPQIIDAFQGAVQTDLSPQQISQLACLGPKLDPRNISFVGFPTNLDRKSVV